MQIIVFTWANMGECFLIFLEEGMSLVEVRLYLPARRRLYTLSLELGPLLFLALSCVDFVVH